MAAAFGRDERARPKRGGLPNTRGSMRRAFLFTTIVAVAALWTLYDHIIQTPPNTTTVMRRRAEKNRDEKTILPERRTNNTEDDWPPLHTLENLFTNYQHNDGDDNEITPKRRRLAVAASNAAYVEFADNWANSLLQWNVSNFVLVPMDAKAYEYLHQAYPAHTLPPQLNNDHSASAATVVSKLAFYGTPAFAAVTSTRPTFLQKFVEKGITVLYNDVDMVWNRNAWEELDRLDETHNKLKIWQDGDNGLCSCLLYLPPTRASLEFLNEWEKEIDSKKHNNDQPAMQEACVTLGIDRLWKSSQMENEQVQVFSNTDEFPTGHMYFREKTGDKSKAVIIHNNWVLGLLKKKERFQEHGLWNLSGRLPQLPEQETVRIKSFKDFVAFVSTNNSVVKPM